jgi:hypothetical protein
VFAKLVTPLPTVPTVPQVAPSVERSTRNPVAPVTLPHVTLIWLADAAVAATFCGAAGIVVTLATFELPEFTDPFDAYTRYE